MTLHVRLGHGLSGWVGATRRAQRNADPRLDLENASVELDRPLLSSLSVPVEDGVGLVGVVTLYADVADAFCESDLDSLRALATIYAR
jgi:GAF domain-containing protein